MMGLARYLVLLLAVSAINSVWCHHHHHGVHSENKKRKDQVEHAWRYGSREEMNAISSADEKNRRSLNIEDAKEKLPYSDRRLEKMLEKAILKIITGDLSAGDMLLLKSLNYSLEEVLAIRERELNKKKEEELRRKESFKSWTKVFHGENVEKKNRYREKNSMDRSTKSHDYEEPSYDSKKNRHADKSSYKDFDFEAYNRQAVLDYENLPSNLEFQQSTPEQDLEEAGKEEDETVRRDFDRVMAPHVVFKIRYDDSEFDSSSGSDETNKSHSKSPRYHVTSKHTTLKTATSPGSSFHVSPLPLSSVPPASLSVPVVPQLGNSVQDRYQKNYPTTESASVAGTGTTKEMNYENASSPAERADVVVHTTSENDAVVVSKIEEEADRSKKVSEYEGLEWVEDDVYRVLPEFVDSLGIENSEDNETSDYEDISRDPRRNWNTDESENDTLEYQNDTPDSIKLFIANNNISAGYLPLANLTTYQQVLLDQRRNQSEKAIQDIKSRVLAMTGRLNNSGSANQVQRQRLVMFPSSCQTPRNTDQDAWTDPFSMNMHFQLNLTSSDHVVAARLRIFKLPQENLTSSTGDTFEEDEEDEKKIRISVYYYTKSLKKHRSKKRLMDSVVTPLTAEGTHLALDVRQSLRFWRLNPRNLHGNGSNHGLVVLVEDQDGRPLKPALYIQQPSCTDQDTDQKAYQRVPALFLRACTRYVRVVNGEKVTYVNCRH
ncbi:uncharacterized protein LOC116427024 isoform X2 [Nomia melanderi]|uniref:uncharacterized protein LOC116427024 isoform X2 n=1 Tax=Nomia melanderi TaxID=2448451 RepID=UPI0013042467|nr:uncharacterized protein LOC116427024 isoform X2 [Nomia melanderi]